MAHNHMLFGEQFTLVQPNHISAKWTKDNLWLRSTLFDANGNAVSIGFPKFFNASESPHITPEPKSLENTTIVDKLDGSLLILSAYKGNIIARTRGTSNAETLANGNEIELFKSKYPELFDFVLKNEGYTILCEWVTPSNKIVINYPEPELYLIGMVNHLGPTLVKQDKLDEIARGVINIKRPNRYTFETLSQLKEAVKAFKGKEGVCLYYNGDQNILKIKGEEYLTLHRLKSELGSFERVVDYWFALGCLSYQETEAKLNETFDYEVFNLCRGDISRICSGWKEVEKIISSMRDKADSLKNLPRREAAAIILQAYGTTNRAGFVFSLLDGKQLDSEAKKKLLYQVLKK